MSTAPAPLAGEAAPSGRFLDQLSIAMRRVERYVAARVRDPADAADIAQESLLRVIERARDVEIAHPDFYALTIARNLVIDRRRGAGTAPGSLDETIACVAPLPDRILHDRQRLAVFRAALAAMPPLRREVFVRRRLHGESREAIARALGMETEAVKKHVTRALAQLARAMAEAEDAPMQRSD